MTVSICWNMKLCDSISICIMFQLVLNCSKLDPYYTLVQWFIMGFRSSFCGCSKFRMHVYFKGRKLVEKRGNWTRWPAGREARHGVLVLLQDAKYIFAN